MRFAFRRQDVTLVLLTPTRTSVRQLVVMIGTVRIRCVRGAAAEEELHEGSVRRERNANRAHHIVLAPYRGASQAGAIPATGRNRSEDQLEIKELPLDFARYGPTTNWIKLGAKRHFGKYVLPSFPSPPVFTNALGARLCRKK
jgi:hypothetical protein